MSVFSDLYGVPINVGNRSEKQIVRAIFVLKEDPKTLEHWKTLWDDAMKKVLRRVSAVEDHPVFDRQVFEAQKQLFFGMPQHPQAQLAVGIGKQIGAVEKPVTRLAIKQTGRVKEKKLVRAEYLTLLIRRQAARAIDAGKNPTPQSSFWAKFQGTDWEQQIQSAKVLHDSIKINPVDAVFDPLPWSEF